MMAKVAAAATLLLEDDQNASRMLQMGVASSYLYSAAVHTVFVDRGVKRATIDLEKS
jgi:hypothetical protein